MSRYIDADAIRNPYSGTSLEWQGMLILKLLDDAPIIKTKTIQYFDEDKKVWTIGEVIVNETD